MMSEELDEMMDSLFESLSSAIHYYNGILDDIKAGTYTPEKAKQDAENLMFNEGNDIISTLESIGEMA